jgi:tagatose 6-phosphate kinase
MILCIGTTPAVQRVMSFGQLTIDAVNRARTTLDGVAGKSINVAKVLQALGEHPVATGFLGGDRGAFVRELLESRGIAHEFVTVSARTRQCVTVIDESAGTHTELVEESPPVEAADLEKLREIVRRRAQGCRAVVMSGTLAPGVPPDFYFECARQAHEIGALSVVDAQGRALLEALKAGPEIVKPNRSELAATVNRDLPDERAVLQAMRDLHDRGSRRVVVTAGKQPALAFDGRSAWRVTPPRVLPMNPIGSGDAFAAGLVWRLMQGESLVESCRWAAATGAANALSPMAGEVDRKVVEQLARDAVVESI